MRFSDMAVVKIPYDEYSFFGQKYYRPDIMDSRDRLKLLGKIIPFIRFEPCEKCNGTGLTGVQVHNDGSYSWNSTYCKHCNGNGGVLVSLNENVSRVCKKCDGVGFSNYLSPCCDCGGKGVFDWLDNVLG